MTLHLYFRLILSTNKIELMRLKCWLHFCLLYGQRNPNYLCKMTVKTTGCLGLLCDTGGHSARAGRS